MAEFCLACLNKINGTEDSAKKYIASKDLDLCEGCGKWWHVVVAERKAYYWYGFHYFLFPFRIMSKAIYFLCRLLLLPYFIYKHNKRKGKD